MADTVLLPLINAVAVPYQDEVLADSPIGYWRLGEASGTTAYDAAGSADGSYVNSPTLGVSGLVVGGDTAATFVVASAQKVSLPFSLPAGSTSGATIECWAKFSSLTTDQYYSLARWGTDGSGYGHFLLYYRYGATAKRIYIQYTDGTKRNPYLAWTPTVGVTYHVVASHDYVAKTCAVYVNGSLLGTMDLSAYGTPTPPPANTDGSLASGMEGTYDEGAFYDHTVSATRASAHYTAGTTGGSTECIFAPTVTMVGSGAAQSVTLPLLASHGDTEGSFDVGSFSDAFDIGAAQIFPVTVALLPLSVYLTLVDGGAAAYAPTVSLVSGTQSVFLPQLDGVRAIFSVSLGAPLRRLRTIQMHVIVYAPDASGGPGAAKMELTPEVLWLTWQRAQNLPGQVAFTLARPSSKLADIDWMKDHIKVFREDHNGLVTVFAGKLVKPMVTADDVICLAWDYKAFLQLSRTGYRTLYPEKLIGSEIVSPEWTAAKAVDTSPFTFVTTGTIQDPLGSDDLTAIKVSKGFGVAMFNRLLTFYQLAEMAMANTSHNVVFEITHSTPHTFNFWKDYGSSFTALDFTYPGNLSYYQHDPGFDALRNDRSTIISTTGGGTEEYNLDDDPSVASYRRLQDAVALRTLVGISTGTTETDQTKAGLARLLVEGVRLPKQFILYPRQGEFSPYIDFGEGDKVKVTLRADDGTTDHDGEIRVTALAGAWSPQGGESLAIYGRGMP
jgi:hypothetical protein